VANIFVYSKIQANQKSVPPYIELASQEDRQLASLSHTNFNARKLKSTEGFTMQLCHLLAKCGHSWFAKLTIAATVCVVSLLLLRNSAIAQQPVVTQNFAVFADDPQYANRVAQDAERYRKELSIAWLGYEIDPWQERCPIRVTLDLHAGGETSFAFLIPPGGDRGQPTGWEMKIFGPPDRLLDAVLPHEITHTIFATHFGRPLPRWADEGACTTVEHQSERSKNHGMLINFLGASPSRGIPFNRMFTMKNYPHDILPLYAQGYSLARFLIQQSGRRQFLDYIADGMENERPGFSDLQIQWIRWVREGSQDLSNPAQLASNRVARPIANQLNDSGFVEPGRDATRVAGIPKSDVAKLPINNGWYAKQMKVNQSTRRVSSRSTG